MSLYYLNCPYNQKDEAKALGAKWDWENKRWYVSGKDEDILNKFKVFSPEKIEVEVKEDVYINPGVKKIDNWVINVPDDFVVLDTEDTGLSKMDEVVELAIIDTKGDEIYHSKFKPTRPMTIKASQVTGFTNDSLANEPLYKDEWENIKKAINGKPIIAYNTKYDKRMMIQTAIRYGIDKEEVEALYKNSLDAMLILKEYYGKTCPLADAAKRFGIKDEQKHLASYDCLMTLQVLIELNEHIKEGEK